MSGLALALAVATILGGIAALAHFWDRFHPRLNRTRRLRRFAQALGLSPDLDLALLTLAIDRPSGWEFRLFEAALSAELDGIRSLEDDVRLGAVDQVCTLEPADFLAWSRDLLVWIPRQLDQLEALFGPAYDEAMGEVGEPGDPVKIIELARRVGGVYRQSLRRQLEVKAVSMPADFHRLLALLVEHLGVVTRMIREARDQLFLSLQRQLAAPKELRPLAGEGVIKLRPVYDTASISRELDRLVEAGWFVRG